MKIRHLVPVLGIAIGLTACGGQQAYQPAYQNQPVYVPQPVVYAESICVNNLGLRVSPLYCQTYHSGYVTDYYQGSNIVVPPIGARVPTGWTTNRPTQTNIHIYNNPPAAGGPVNSQGNLLPPQTQAKQAPAKAPAVNMSKAALPQIAPKPLTPQAQSSVMRGGLGVKTK